VGAALSAIAKCIRGPGLPGLPPKGDVADWLAVGGNEALDALVDEAPDWLLAMPAADKSKETDEADQKGEGEGGRAAAARRVGPPE
jgi:hypothetical protein